METLTVLYIFFAAIVALGFSLFQYFYKRKAKGTYYLLLAFFRFVGIFGIFLLLINPEFSKPSYTLEKTNLVILADNSTSILESGTMANNLVSEFGNSNEIAERFNIDNYKFGSDVAPLDSLSFTERITNIHKSLSSLKDVYAREQTVTVLLTDGNQTIGQDYGYFKPDSQNTVYAIVLGDTTKYRDLSVGPVQTNKYAFLNNKFQLETYISYQGNAPVAATVSISMNEQVVYRENIKLDYSNNLKPITTKIDANTVGVKNIEVRVTTVPEERNTANNSRRTTVEVIDEKTKIALVSDLLHPDLGTLKKAIESNEQRSVSIFKSSEPTATLESMDLLIFYQPTVSFRNHMAFAKLMNANTFILTGTHTDYSFLNEMNMGFEIENGYPEQEVFGLLNTSFSKYDISNLDLSDFPPLVSDAGPLLFSQPYEALLGTQIRGLDVQEPLWSVWETNARRQSLLTGEGLWKWRMQTYRNTDDFSNFDEFVGNLIRYLTTTKNKARLNVDYEKVYDGSSNVFIRATYFDEAFLFEPNAKINITVTNTTTNETSTTPMVLKNSYFEVDLTNLLPGEYSFKVTVEKEPNIENGIFSISEFDMENQFVSSNVAKLNQLALGSGGETYYPSELDVLLQDLIANDAYVPTEKRTENVVSLIDFKILLAIIAFAFAAEWFIRKYNGLI